MSYMYTFDFVIPMYNEEKRIEKTIKALLEWVNIDDIVLKNIIFVNDGSTDKTLTILQKNLNSIESKLNAKVQIISYEKNRGKGYAVKIGMLASISNYALFFDADMSTPLGELNKFVPQIRKNADVVIGTRKNGKSTVVVHQPVYRELLGKGFTLLSNIILNTWVSDFTCGFKAFSNKAIRDIFPNCTIERWGYDSEIMFLSRKYGYKAIEVPVKWYDDKNTKVNLGKAVISSFTELLTIRLNDITGVYTKTLSNLSKLNLGVS